MEIDAVDLSAQADGRRDGDAVKLLLKPCRLPTGGGRTIALDEGAQLLHHHLLLDFPDGWVAGHAPPLELAEMLFGDRNNVARARLVEVFQDRVVERSE